MKPEIRLPEGITYDDVIEVKFFHEFGGMAKVTVYSIEGEIFSLSVPDNPSNLKALQEEYEFFLRAMELERDKRSQQASFTKR